MTTTPAEHAARLRYIARCADHGWRLGDNSAAHARAAADWIDDHTPPFPAPAENPKMDNRLVDRRSIAGQLREEIEAWHANADAIPEDRAAVGEDLAAAAQALLDCQPAPHKLTYLELEDVERDHAREIQRLRADVADLTRLRDRLGANLAASEARAEQAEVERDRLRDALKVRTAERDAARAELKTDPFAAIARAAADHAEGAHTDDAGTYRQLRGHLSDTIGTATMFRTSRPDAARITIAAMLALGAARFGSRRQDADLANRTADYLRTLAGQIDAPTTTPTQNP